MSDRCSGTPVSWLALERRRLGELAGRDAEMVDAHLAGCPACRGCYQSLETSDVVLAPLVLPVATAKPRFKLSWGLAPAVALAALALLWRVGGDDAGLGPGVTGIKGGSIAIELVRESKGALLEPTHFGRGDRFKVLVTCVPAARGQATRVEVAVYQASGVSRPLPPARLHCGNAVAVPGAFALRGGPAKVCVLVGDDVGAGTTPPGGAACVALEPAP